METTIRKANCADVEGIVKIHQAAFPDFFLTSLGERFLKLYYGTFINCKEGVVYCAEKGNTLVGFSATSYVSRGFHARLIKKNIIKYVVEAIAILLVRPKSIVRLLKNLDKESSDSKIVDNGLYAELYSIGVSPSCQGEGVGKRLLTITEEDVSAHNGQISLTTDYYDNEKTMGFYRSLGYEDYYEFVTYPNRKMWRLIKHLHNKPHSQH